MMALLIKCCESLYEIRNSTREHRRLVSARKSKHDELNKREAIPKGYNNNGNNIVIFNLYDNNINNAKVCKRKF